jgi:hypothetical protein
VQHGLPTKALQPTEIDPVGCFLYNIFIQCMDVQPPVDKLQALLSC